MSRICDISGKRANNANRVSFSNKHWARWQYPNLQSKKLYSKELDRYVRVKVATSHEGYLLWVRGDDVVCARRRAPST